MLKIAILEEEINNVSLIDVISDLNMRSLKVVKINDLSNIDFDDFDVLIFSQNVLASNSLKSVGEKVKDFVHKGGICWIMHQNEAASLDWLPCDLSEIKLENRYIATPSGAMEYVGPWIVNRHHPLWNKPNYVDEGRFVLWDVKINGKRYRTAATHVILQKGWEVLARFVDHEIKPENEAAIVMQAPYGRGMFFWTQIFSPQVVWKPKIDFHVMERIFEKESSGSTFYLQACA